MRVLLWACGSRGDVEPLVALAVRLRALGVEVRMCAPADSAERLAEADVPLEPIKRLEGAGSDRRGRAPESSAAAVIAEQFERMPAVAEGCDAVVASGLLSGAAAVRSVAEKLGIPYFYVVLSPVHLPSALGREQRAQYNQGAARRFGAAITSGRASIGLPPVENLVDYGSTDRPWLAADPVLAPLADLPMKLDVQQTPAWILPDERPLSAELEAFLAAGPPPVYVGFGSGPTPADTARVAVEAIRAQGRRMILSRGWAGLTPADDADDCFALGEANLQALFRRVAVAIHHCGTGTTHVATRAGVPQVVVHQVAGQFYYADRLVELGIGVAHGAQDPTVESLSAALATALDPPTRARAAEVAATMRDDGAAVAAQMLFEAVREQSPSVSV